MNAIGWLQEYCQKQCLSMPKYDLMNHVVSANSNVFTIRVTCGDLRAEGTDLSKKAAKTKAATNMIELMKTRGVIKTTIVQNNNSIGTPEKSYDDIRPESNAGRPLSNNLMSSSNHFYINSVGKLQELCVKHHYGTPKYECVDKYNSDGHKMICIIGNMREEAIGQNKKTAKQMCAELMWKRVMAELGNGFETTILAEKTKIHAVELLGKKIEELCIKNPVTIPLCIDKAKDLYAELSRIKTVDNGKKVSVTDYHLYYKSTLDAQTLKTIYNYYTNSTLKIGDLKSLQKTLKGICCILKTEYKISPIPSAISDLEIAACTICIMPDFTEMGVGKTRDDAESSAVFRMINTVKSLLN